MPGFYMDLSKRSNIIKGSGTIVTLVSPNMCDPTSWWTNAVSKTDEVLTTSDRVTYSGSENRWINLSRIVDDHKLVGYGITVTRNDDVVSESEYTINHENGEVTFSSAQLESDVIKASYKYATTSTWVIAPTPGRILKINHVELDMTVDVGVHDNVCYFEVMAGDTVVGQNKYKGAIDMLCRCNLGYHIPKFGELNSDVIVLPWDYEAAIELKSSLNMSIRLRLGDGVTPYSGQLAVVTAYGLSEAE